MYSIALTSIPPRLPRLGPVLASLLSQDPAPARVILCLPKRFRRFSAGWTSPALPEGVECLRVAEDFGPATKALGPARMLSGSQDALIYCDDDWIYPQGWAAALLSAQAPGMAVAATGFGVDRLGRRGVVGPNLTDIAQGYSGVLVCPDWLAGADMTPPSEAWAVDDIWLSGQLARQGIPICLAPAARASLEPAYHDAYALQDAAMDGMSRHDANMACAALLNRLYGIWPEL